MCACSGAFPIGSHDLPDEVGESPAHAYSSCRNSPKASKPLGAAKRWPWKMIDTGGATIGDFIMEQLRLKADVNYGLTGCVPLARSSWSSLGRLETLLVAFVSGTLRSRISLSRVTPTLPRPNPGSPHCAYDYPAARGGGAFGAQECRGYSRPMINNPVDPKSRTAFAWRHSLTTCPGRPHSARPSPSPRPA